MKYSGTARLGVGFGCGADKTAEAAKEAINSPLTDDKFKEARVIIFCVMAPPPMSLNEIEKARGRKAELAGKPEADKLLFNPPF